MKLAVRPQVPRFVIAVALCSSVFSFALTVPHGALEIRVADDGRTTAVARLSIDENKSFTALYVLLPFNVHNSSISVDPPLLLASSSIASDSSLLVLFVPPRTTNLVVTTSIPDLIKPVDQVRRKLELNFLPQDPPRGLDGVLQQSNVIFRYSQVVLVLPDNASELQESKQASGGLNKRRYLLTDQDDNLAISWRGAPSKGTVLFEAIANGMLGLFMGMGIGIALYNFSRRVPAMVLAGLALVSTVVRLYQAAQRGNFPWNDGLPLAATFLGIFLALVVSILLMFYRPYRQTEQVSTSAQTDPAGAQGTQQQTNG